MKLIGIKYVGKKDHPQKDTVLRTDRVWPDTKHVEWVPEKDVPAYLKHPDVWAAVGEKTSKDVEVLGLESAKPVVKEVEPEYPPLVHLETMDRNALRDYAQRNFGQVLHHAMSEANMRTKIQNMMNSPMFSGG
jgi:hypothetical protein